MKKTIICLIGPTAAGKTEVAVSLAKRIGAEVISCDSMQVYKGMDIGTAKPSPQDLAVVAHHLIDVVAPDEPFTVAAYKALAKAAIDDIDKRGKREKVTRGTGLYISDLTQGLC